MIKILFDTGLDPEANFLAEVIRTSFTTEVLVSESDSTRYLTFNTSVGGYEVREGVGAEFDLVLTAKDLFIVGATSPTDDYFYGYCADNGLFYFSVARLKSENDTPTLELQVMQTMYERRLAYIAVHEMGHWFVKDARHMKKYFYVNHETGHQQDNGWHCTNDGCVMRAVDDLKMLDERAADDRISFCAQCKQSLSVSSGMPLLP